MTQPVIAKIEHDIDDGSGRSVKILLEGLAGPSFELFSEPVAGGGLKGELHVLAEDGRNHGTKPYLVEVGPAERPLATAQRFAEQVWAVIDQEYLEQINNAKHSKALSSQINQQVRALVLEDRLRKQEVLGDIVDAFVNRPEPKWTGWKRAHVVARLASLKLADDLGVTQPALDQFYDIAARAMQGGVKTFNQFETKLREGLGDQFTPFLKALGGYTGLRPVWDAVVERDEDDLNHSLEDLRISPRIPSAVQDTKKQRKVPLEDPHGPERLQPDLAAMVKDPAALAHNVNLMLQYPEFQGITGITDTEKAEHIIEHMTDNLVWLYNQWNHDHRNRSKNWYVGGSRIAHRWAERFHVAPQAVAGVMAALSPQQHWFQNVTLAERVISALVEHYDQPWDDAMTQVVLTRDWGGVAHGAPEEVGDPEADDEASDIPDDLESTPDTPPAADMTFAPVDIDYDSTKKLKPYSILGNLQGKSLHDLEGDRPMDQYLQAVWIRAYDEAHNPNGCRNVSPEGEFGDWYRTDNGAPVKNRWNSFGEIMKAIRVFKDPSVRSISDNAGANHKVRSFYNNLIAPLSQGGDVTIDTHAVAAALVRPLSSSSVEVLHNFGSGKTGNGGEPGIPGPTNSKVTGNTGLYGFYAEAYRRAAQKVGIQPREMQSITWECVRGLFKPAQKRDKKFVQSIDNQWRRYSHGISSKDTTRNNILALAGNGDPAHAVEPPAWSMAHPGDAEGTRDSSYSGQLSGDLQSGQEPRGPNAPGGGARAASRAATWLGRGDGRLAKLLCPKTARFLTVDEVRAGKIAEQIQDGVYSMSLQEAIDEHEKLVHALETPSHVDDAQEAQEQGSELKEMQKAQRKHAKLLQAKKKDHSEAYLKETEAINERAKTLEGRRPHKFQAAEWTAPNGHPRCKVCGDEEPESGHCCGKVSKLLQAKDLKPAPKQPASARLNSKEELAAWLDQFLAGYNGVSVSEGYMDAGNDQRLSFLMGPDAMGDPYVSTFTSGFQGRVKTEFVDLRKMSGPVLATWVASRINTFPISAMARVQAMPKLKVLTAQEIAAGALDKMLAPYPDPMFQIWLLKTWATGSYEQVGKEGSSRTCFKLDNDHALKIAMNPAGQAQNMTESHIAQNFHDLPITQVHYMVKGGMALVVDFAHQLVPADFKRDFGLSFTEFCSSVTKLIHAKPVMVEDLMMELPPPARKLLDSLERHGIGADDLRRPEQWGDFKHHAVIIDYGLTHEVWTQHYKAKRQPAEAQNGQVKPRPPHEVAPVKLVKPKEPGDPAA